MTEQQKKEERAARFGLTSINTTAPTEQSRIKQRALRFGQPSSAKPAPSSKSPAAPTPKSAPPVQSASAKIPLGISVDALKKRAERFGVVSPLAEAIHFEDALKKRADRFSSGSVATKPVVVNKRPSSAEGTDDFEQRRKQRAERFGGATGAV
ncbi:hypothetical protein BJ741DRAFT_650409 [Chytriomyces cf. hyalinus JEL632]|nr:hypothetical protein BJ741DRAFT_650409 [Chytriomyces cf. hyalinus JEL632]